MFVQFLRFYIFFGSAFLILQAVGQITLTKKTRVNYLYATFYMALGIILLAAVNADPNLIWVVPEFSLADAICMWSLGPLMYSIYTELLEKKKSVRLWIHFIIPVGVSLSLIPYYILPSELKADRLLQLFNNPSAGGFSYEYLFGLGGLYTFAYIAFGFKDLIVIWKINVLKSEKPVQVIALIGAMAIFVCGLSALGVIFNDFIFVRLGASSIVLGASIIFLIGHRYSHFNQTLATIVNQTKYKKSYIKDLDLGKIQTDLDTLMTEQKIFRDDELSLSLLSQELNISIHQLSQYLNEIIKKNFSGFINEYRIAEAKELLKDMNNTNILRIAYDVGFSSKTSFNRSFSKIVGVSPIKYRTNTLTT